VDVKAKEVLNRLRRYAIAHYEGEIVPADRLIQAGLDALLNGIDTPAIRRLAGLSRREEPESHDLFAQVIVELDLLPGMSDDAMSGTREARWQMVRSWARQIVDDVLDPVTGGNLIWYMGWERLGRPAALRPIVGWTSQAEDQPTAPWTAGAREVYANLIIDAARELLDGPWPPEARDET
jgi:hypothetical protein